MPHTCLILQLSLQGFLNLCNHMNQFIQSTFSHVFKNFKRSSGVLLIVGHIEYYIIIIQNSLDAPGSFDGSVPTYMSECQFFGMVPKQKQNKVNSHEIDFTGIT